MNEKIPDPVRGKDVIAWALPVTRALNALADKTGATARNERDRKPAPRPFEVVGSSGDDYKFAVYVPEHVVAIGKEDDIDPDGITAIDDAEDWYMLDDEDEVSSSGKTLYLIAYDDETAEFKFEIPSSCSASEDHKIVGILPIAELKTQSVGQKTVGCVVRQLACHPFSVGTGGGNLSAEGTVVTSVDYVISEGDPDFEEHAYSIRVTRGTLTISGGVLSIVEDPDLTQFIETTPLTSEDY